MIEDSVQFPDELRPRVQTTLVILKPENFTRPSRRPGNIIDVFAGSGCYFVGAKLFAMTVNQVLEFYGKNPQLKDQLRAPIFEDKAVDFIFELAEVSDKAVTREELMRDPDEPPASESK